MIFRFAQISDQHCGYKSGRFKDPNTGANLREQDGHNAHNEAIDGIIDYNNNKNKIELTLGTGDLFHSPAPSIYTITEVKKALSKLVDNEIPFWNIAGNHDSTDSVRDVPANAVVNEPRLNLNSLVEPYKILEVADGEIVFHLVSHHGYLLQNETFKKVNPIEGKFNILVTHGSVYDTALNVILHSESEPREVVITEELMNKGWDYTLLGHIHERGWVHSEDRMTDTSGRKQFYGGSLIRRGFSDKESKLGRGWTLWTIDTEKRTMTPEFFNVKQRFQRDIVIFCENKTAEEVEKELLERFSKIDFSKMPILRATFIDLSPSVNLQINWTRLLEKTKSCLTFSVKIKTKEEFKAELENNNYSYDLVSAYTEFLDNIKESIDEEYRSFVKKESLKYLKEGQERVMK